VTRCDARNAPGKKSPPRVPYCVIRPRWRVIYPTRRPQRKLPPSQQVHSPQPAISNRIWADRTDERQKLDHRSSRSPYNGGVTQEQIAYEAKSRIQLCNCPAVLDRLSDCTDYRGDDAPNRGGASTFVGRPQSLCCTRPHWTAALEGGYGQYDSILTRHCQWRCVPECSKTICTPSIRAREPYSGSRRQAIPFIHHRRALPTVSCTSDRGTAIYMLIRFLSLNPDPTERNGHPRSPTEAVADCQRYRRTSGRRLSALIPAHAHRP
jgi:hypothetical protein